MGASLLSSVSLSNVVPFVCLVLVVFSKTVTCEQDAYDGDLRDKYFDECVLNSSTSTEGRRGRAWYNYTQINILSLIPCTIGNPSEDKNCEFMDYLPILAMVEDEINERDDILKGYRLKLSNIDSGCNGDRASLNYFKDVTDTLSGNGSVKHMIMGPACTVATEPVAGLGKYMNMSQVSYTASGPQFAKNRTIYSRFYTMQPLVTLYNDAYLAIFKRYKWTRIAIIHEVDPLFTEGANDLSKKAETNGITVEYFGNFVDDPTSNLQAIQENDIRIIVALFNPRNLVAVHLWCNASSMGLTDAHHVWFTPVWAQVEPGDNSCGETAITEALNFSFGTLGSDMRKDKNALLVSNKTVQDVTDILDCYKSMYNASKYRNFSSSVTLKEGYVYDSVWAIALALNDTIAELEANGSMYKLEDFQYSNIEMANMMLENLQAVNFNGISGHIFFDGNDSSDTTGNRQEHTIEIRQYNGMLDTELKAYYYTNSKKIDLVDGKDFSWRDGSPPPDRPKPIQVLYAPWAVGISCLSSGAGVILSLVCLTFTVYYRKHRVFKRATPRLNVMICLGTLVGFSSTFLYSMVLNFYQNLPHNKEPREDLTGILTVCNLVNWLTYIGFTLAFGSLLMKTWRLYRIFYNPEIRKRKYLEDRFLILGVIGMLVIVLVILVVWTGVAHTKWCESTSFSDDNLVEYRYFHCCASDDPNVVYIWYIFLGIMTIAFAIVLLFGMFMAYQIKKNLGRMLHKYTETPLINISAVMALTFSNIFLILHWVLPIEAADTLSSLLLLVALRDGFWMYPMLLILYIPMAYELVQDKRGKRRRFSSRGSIASHVEAFSQRHRRDSSFSSSSYSLDERRPSFSASATFSNKTPRPLSPLKEEITTEVQEESSARDSGDVTPNTGRVSFAVGKSIGEDEVFNPNPSDRHHNASPIPLDDMSNRRPSILKSGPLIDIRKTDQRVKFTVSK